MDPWVGVAFSTPNSSFLRFTMFFGIGLHFGKWKGEMMGECVHDCSREGFDGMSLVGFVLGDVMGCT